MTLLIDAELPGAIAARDGLLVVSGGELVLANAAICRMLGTSVYELLGEPPPAWIPSAPASGRTWTSSSRCPGARVRSR